MFNGDYGRVDVNTCGPAIGLMLSNDLFVLSRFTWQAAYSVYCVGLRYRSVSVIVARDAVGYLFNDIESKSAHFNPARRCMVLNLYDLTPVYGVSTESVL